MARLIDNTKATLIRKYHALNHTIKYIESGEDGLNTTLYHNGTRLQKLKDELNIVKIKMNLLGMDLPPIVEQLTQLTTKVSI